MDKSLKGFLKLSLAIISIFFIAIVFLAVFYQYSTLNTYNFILLFLAVVIILLMLLLASSILAIIVTYKRRRTNKVLKWLIKFGLKMLMPSVLNSTGIHRGNSDNIRQFYIDMNNMLVENAVERKYSPEDILVILPHCLQNSNCGYKVTGALSNCKRCGKCSIGEIAAISDEIGVTAEIVTGGTAARNIINEKKPGIILSVACERDLASGISDISGIPVLGIINERPFGPCSNTNVDVKMIKERLQNIIYRV